MTLGSMSVPKYRSFNYKTRFTLILTGFLVVFYIKLRDVQLQRLKCKKKTFLKVLIDKRKKTIMIF